MAIPLQVEAQPERVKNPVNSADPLVIDSHLPELLVLCPLGEEEMLTAEEIANIKEIAEEYKKLRDEKPPRGTLRFLYSSMCRPSKEVKKEYDELDKKYQGEVIECDKNPTPPECQPPALVPSLIITFPGPPERTETIKGKNQVKEFLEALK